MLENCKKGNHNLVELASWAEDMYETVGVVRWCSVCGCVIGDSEYDNRVYPGGLFRMKAPKLFKRFLK